MRKVGRPKTRDNPKKAVWVDLNDQEIESLKETASEQKKSIGQLITDVIKLFLLKKK